MKKHFWTKSNERDCKIRPRTHPLADGSQGSGRPLRPRGSGGARGAHGPWRTWLARVAVAPVHAREAVLAVEPHGSGRPRLARLALQEHSLVRAAATEAAGGTRPGRDLAGRGATRVFFLVEGQSFLVVLYMWLVWNARLNPHYFATVR